MFIIKASLFVSCLCLFLQASAETPINAVTEMNENKTSIQKPSTGKSRREANRNISMTYVSSAWNRSSTKIDSAFLFVKDRESGKLVKIVLEEAEPDSSTFSGNFSIDWGNLEASRPEVFIPPINLRNNEEDIKKFNTQVTEGKIPRKPVVVRKTKEGRQILDVYDTKDQAERAYKSYLAQLALERKLDQQSQTALKPLASEQNLQVSKMAEQERALLQLAKEAASREMDRIRIEQLERQRVEELRKKQDLLAESEKKKQRAEAEKFAVQALAAYNASDFAAAEDLFRKSTDLDPDNLNYQFQYGVTLYRNEKFNDALVALKIAPENESNRLEKKYYMALIHFRLKELEAALSLLREIKSKAHPMLSPSSAFYEGVILFGQEKYDEARAPFEFVLDASSDPQLDARAEDFLEKITGILNFKEQAKKKWLGTLSLGLIQDSNIVFAPNSDSVGTATDKAGARVLSQVALEWRWIYEYLHELSLKANALRIYSFSQTKFKHTDPLMSTITMPYIYKGAWKGRGYKLSLAPGYEVLNMDTEGKGAKNIQSTLFTNLDGTLIMSDKWFSNYILEVRQENSSLSTSIDANDSDVLKYGVKTTQTIFTDTEKKRALSGNLGLTLNPAKGDNKKFTRYDIGVSYSHPIRWDASLSYNLAYYIQKFDKADTALKRTDKNTALNISFLKNISKSIAWSVLGNFTVNQSDDSADLYSYDKWSLTTLLTYSFEK